MTPEQCAYLAGLIDGEGSIGLFFNNAPTRTNGAVLARLKIGMCDEPLIRWLKTCTNTCTITSWRKHHTRWKTCWVATWNGGAAADLIQLVWPYLRLKRKQAKLLCRWVAISRKWRAKVGGRARGDRKYPDSVWRQAERLAVQIRELNHRGTPACR
jgi:hypothetical protein